LVRKAAWKIQLGRPRLRWEDIIGLDLGGIRWEGVDWMHLAQDRDKWRVPCKHGPIKGGKFLD
jgi:hypothetical protein